METIENISASEMEDVKKQFENYQKKQTQTKKKSSEEILAKYFVPRKPKETFRILPPKNGKKAIEEAFFHVVPTNGTGGKKKKGSIIYCPAHNDPKVPKIGSDGQPATDMSGRPIMVPAPCPCCEQYKRLIAKQDQSLKGIKKEKMDDRQLKIKENNDKIYKEAISWEAKKFYIIRGIDKGLDKDGVKFWRFKHNFKNQGTLDKLLPVLGEYMEQTGVLFSDPYKGCDLSITMVDTEMKLPNGGSITYKTITSITTRQSTSLHNDPIVMKQWLEDDITWRHVFMPKKAPNITPYQYLEMIIKGETPYWDDSDQNNKHWVFPNHKDLEILANTRTQNLDDVDENYEQASDLDNSYVTINNIKPSDVGVYKDNSINLGKVALRETTPQIQEAPIVENKSTKKVKKVKEEPVVVVEPPTIDPEDDPELDDLPF
jgi:glutaredoxin